MTKKFGFPKDTKTEICEVTPKESDHNRLVLEDNRSMPVKPLCLQVHRIASGFYSYMSPKKQHASAADSTVFIIR